MTVMISICEWMLSLSFCFFQSPSQLQTEMAAILTHILYIMHDKHWPSYRKITCVNQSLTQLFWELRLWIMKAAKINIALRWFRLTDYNKRFMKKVKTVAHSYSLWFHLTFWLRTLFFYKGRNFGSVWEDFGIYPWSPMKFQRHVFGAKRVWGLQWDHCKSFYIILNYII